MAKHDSHACPVGYCVLAQIGSMRLNAVGSLPEVNSHGRGMSEIDKYKRVVLGVDHES
jgi:hypothetical protein